MGAALKDVELELALHLEASVPGLSTASSPPSLYAGPFPAEGPEQLVCVRDTGGDDTDDFQGGGGTLAAEVQVVVRGQKGKYAATRTLARACWQALHLAPVAGYIQVKSEGAGPMYMGPDDHGRPRFSFNAAAEYVFS